MPIIKASSFRGWPFVYGLIAEKHQKNGVFTNVKLFRMATKQGIKVCAMTKNIAIYFHIICKMRNFVTKTKIKSY
jgi:hypothetical protein